jgi:hypothetical protein
MDPSKFFNRKINIRDPKTPYSKGKFVDESENYSNRVSSRINQSPLTKSLFSFRNKIFRLENLLTGILGLDKRRQEQNKKIKAAEVPDKKPKTKGPQLFGKLIQKPKTGALDLIRDFVTFTFLGWLFTRIQPLLGGLTKLAPLLEGMAWFIGGTIKNMVDIFATFLKLGFDAKEKFDSIVGDIKKNTKGIDKVFDATLNPLKAVFDGVIQLANSFLSVSVKEDQLNEARTQLAKEETVDNVPPMPPLPKVDAPQTPQTSDTFPEAPTRPGIVQAAHTGGIIRGYNKGGRIDPTTPITRGVETQRREVPKPKPIIQPQKSTPGKDVGGDKKVKQLYDQTSAGIPDFIPLPSFFRTDKKSGFAALMGASEEYKKPMTNDILGIGNMMGASVDSALGQKIEKKSYTQFADGIKYLVNYGRTEPEEFAKLDLEDMVRKIVEPRVNMAINRIQEEINKKSTVEPGPSGGMEGGDIGTIDIGGFSPEDVDALGRMIAAESRGEDALGKAAVLAVILNRYRLIKSGTAPSQFNISGKTGDQVTIRDILFARGQFSPYADGNFDRTSSEEGRKALADAIESGGNDPNKLKQNLLSSRYKLNELDADYVVRSTFFSNPETRGSVPVPGAKEVAVGRHSFQESHNVKLTGQIGAIDASISNNLESFDSNNSVLKKLGSTSILENAGENMCTASVILTMHKNGLPNPDGTGDDRGNNPRGLIVQLIRRFGWVSIPVGTPITLVSVSSYGQASAHQMTKDQYLNLVNSGKIPSGALVFQTRHPSWNGTSAGSRGFDSAIARNGGRNLWNGIMNGPLIYSNTNKVIVLVPRGSVSTRQESGNIVLAKKDNKEGVIIEEKGQKLWRERRWTPEERKRKDEETKKTQQSTSQQLQTPRQAPRTSSSGPLTPLASSDRRGFLINNQMYYVDLKTGFITNSQGKTINDESIGNAILQRLTPSDRQRLEKLKKQKGSQNIPWWGRMLPGISSIKPNLPAEKYLSYNQPDSQKPSYIQPVIINSPIPVPVSSGAVAFLPPRISSSKSNLA